MLTTIEMPEVLKCEARGCAYNKDLQCHARGITVGDLNHQHLCDTMWAMKGHTHRVEGAGVGACRETHCVHNEDLECQSDGINVNFEGNRAQCGTFVER